MLFLKQNKRPILTYCPKEKNMTFAAVIKNLISMYSSSGFERLFICYKAEAMLKKSDTTRIHDIKLFRCRWRDNHSRLNYDRHTHEQRHAYPTVLS